MKARDYIVLEENKSTVDNISKQIEKYQRIQQIGTSLFIIGSSSFVVTVLSPFDFEGPVAEILACLIGTTGTIMKATANNKLNRLDPNQTYQRIKKK